MNILPLVQLWITSDEGNSRNVDVHSRGMLWVCLHIDWLQSVDLCPRSKDWRCDERDARWESRGTCYCWFRITFLGVAAIRYIHQSYKHIRRTILVLSSSSYWWLFVERNWSSCPRAQCCVMHCISVYPKIDPVPNCLAHLCLAFFFSLTLID